ncbi:hypothetical protein K1T71_002625 [Dendrolimus kikuchii]|uniref:Uncharacterized protein n=1 Tax=Dendrolimus kikuchii TaxID=765133 RepID=A0ACC1DE53_9NEOP|nr:hypothetical protein K1T71_002625 [Dendrolimus kikuchii]
MRILLSELGLSGACLSLTLEPRATSLEPEKPAPGQRPHDNPGCILDCVQLS